MKKAVVGSRESGVRSAPTQAEISALIDRKVHAALVACTAPAAPPPVRMIDVEGQVFNADHIAKVDLRTPGRAVIHSTIGAEVFEGATAEAIRRYYTAPAPEPKK